MPMSLRRLLFGDALPTAHEVYHRLTKVQALAVFSSDALSSVAYATEEILLVLVLAGSSALALSVPIALVIAVLLVVVGSSYYQTIHGYPSGGGAYRRLTTDPSDTSPAGYGSRVVFMSARDGNWELYAVNMDGSGLKRLTNNSANDGLPTWSPDGRSIAFVSNRGGAWAIWVMDASGDNQRKLFDLDGGYGSGTSDWIYERISWSP